MSTNFRLSLRSVLRAFGNLCSASLWTRRVTPVTVVRRLFDPGTIGREYIVGSCRIDADAGLMIGVQRPRPVYCAASF